jgi:hypothetical protein
MGIIPFISRARRSPDLPAQPDAQEQQASAPVPEAWREAQEQERLARQRQIEPDDYAPEAGEEVDDEEEAEVEPVPSRRGGVWRARPRQSRYPPRESQPEQRARVPSHSGVPMMPMRRAPMQVSRMAPAEPDERDQQIAALYAAMQALSLREQQREAQNIAEQQAYDDYYYGDPEPFGGDCTGMGRDMSFIDDQIERRDQSFCKWLP